ncbi:MAG: hypothetical protein ACI9NT_002065, partial [Bacteroidia bacterium]
MTISSPSIGIAEILPAHPANAITRVIAFTLAHPRIELLNTPQES